MRILRTIVAGSKEPENKEVLWANLKDKKLKVFNNAAWEDLGGRDITELDGGIINKGTIPEDALVQGIQDKLSLLPGESDNIPDSVVRRNPEGEILASTSMSSPSDALVNKSYITERFLLSEHIQTICYSLSSSLLTERSWTVAEFQDQFGISARDFMRLLEGASTGFQVGSVRYPKMSSFIEAPEEAEEYPIQICNILSAHFDDTSSTIQAAVSDYSGIIYKFLIDFSRTDDDFEFLFVNKVGTTRVIDLTSLDSAALKSLQLEFYKKKKTAIKDRVFTWKDSSTGSYLTASNIQQTNWTTITFFGYYIYSTNIRRFSVSLTGGKLTTDIKNYPLFKQLVFDEDASKSETLAQLKTYNNNPSIYAPVLKFGSYIITSLRIGSQTIEGEYPVSDNFGNRIVRITWDSTNGWNSTSIQIPKEKDAVLYTAQSLTDNQKSVARSNIGALADSSAIITTDHIADKAVTLTKLGQDTLNLVAKVPLKQDILSATNKLDGSFINFKNNTIPYWALSSDTQVALQPPVQISSDLDILETIKTYTADEFSSAFTYYEDFFTDAVAGARIISTDQASEGKAALVVSTFHNSVELGGNTTTNDFVYIITATGKFRTITQTYKSADNSTTITVGAWTPWADQ